MLLRGAGADGDGESPTKPASMCTEMTLGVFCLRPLFRIAVERNSLNGPP